MPDFEIFLIEDNPDDATMATRILKAAAEAGKFGELTFRIFRLSVLGELAPALKQTTPDIILLDLHLPDISDFQALPLTIALCPQAQIIVLSGLPCEAVSSATQLYSDCRYASKDPARIYELIDMVQLAMLESARRKERLEKANINDGVTK